MKMNIYARSNVLLWPTNSGDLTQLQQADSRVAFQSCFGIIYYLCNCPLPDIHVAKLTHN